MLSLFRTLSLRYLTKHRVRAALVIATIALGVAVWVATKSLYGAVTHSLRQAASPLRGDADFYVTNFAARFIDASLSQQLEKRVPGIKKVEPLILENIKVVGEKPADAVLIGMKGADQKPEDDDPVAKRGFEIFDLDEELLRQVLFRNHLVEALKPYAKPQWAPPLIQPPVLRPLLVPRVEQLARAEPLIPVFVGERLNRDVLKGARQFTIEAGDRRQRVIVVGKVRAEGPTATLGGQAVLMLWESAALVLGRPGKVHRLDVTLKPDADRERVMQDTEAVLGGQAKAQTASEQDDRLRQVMKGLEFGFMLSGAGALVVGLFLVYNTMSVTVAERRHDIGILRSVGATRTQIRLLFLAEALVLGIVGALLGLPLGLAIAHLSLGPIQDLLQGIFLPVPRNAIRASPGILLSAGLGGLLTALLAALVPASNAAKEEPADAVRRAPSRPGIAYRILQLAGSLTLILLGVTLIAIRSYLTPALVVRACLGLVGVGIVLTAAGYWLLGRSSVAEPTPTTGHRPMTAIIYGLIFVVVGNAGLVVRDQLTTDEGAFAAVVLILLGALLLSPMCAALLTRLLQRLLRPVLPIESRLALDNLVRSPGRTGLVIAALAAGVSLTVTTAGMIKSNEVAFRKWLDRTVTADLFLATGGAASATGQPRMLSPGLTAELFKDRLLPEGTRLVGEVYRYPEWDSRNRRSGTGGAGGSTIVFMTLVDAAERYLANAERDGTEYLDLWQRLGAKPGLAIVSENFSLIHSVQVGDRIALEGNSGKQDFEIIGIMVDYNWIRGSIWIDRRFNREAFAADEVNRWEIYLPSGHRGDEATLRDEIQQSSLGARHALIGLTRDEVRGEYFRMIHNLFGLAYTQQVVVGLVAVIGVITALLISVLSRTREIGLLRALGATRLGVVHTVLAEAVFIGLVGTILGIAIGLPLEWYFVRVILFEEAKFLFPVAIPWVETALIAFLATFLATLAGLWPALKAIRLRISDAIAYE